jgi:hypothetical protein
MYVPRRTFILGRVSPPVQLPENAQPVGDIPSVRGISWLSSLPRGGYGESPCNFGFSAGAMASRTSDQQTGRARRYALRFPVYFRELDSPTWIEGRTENISHTGVLFQSSSSLALESKIELRVQVTVGPGSRGPAEIHCKGVVVRLEQRNVPKTSLALAVAMRGSRIVRQPEFNQRAAGNV